MSGSRTATKAFHVYDEETSAYKFYDVGAKVPESVKVGDHVFEKDAEPDEDAPSPLVVSPDPAATWQPGEEDPRGEFSYAPSQPDPASVDVEAQVVGNLPADPTDNAPTGEQFDPSAEGVKAKDVHDYLTGLDRDTEEGDTEYDRVVAAEKAGQDRSTAIPS